jgi:hypothetical protein
MSEHHSLFGHERYPSTGLYAVLARLGFLATGVAIVVAVLAPSLVPAHVLRSHYLEHFAAFYVATLFGLAAMPRKPLNTVGSIYLIFAALLEASHLIDGAALRPLIDNWVADLGGIAAALVPVLVERFRRRFRPPPPDGDGPPF